MRLASWMASRSVGASWAPFEPSLADVRERMLPEPASAYTARSRWRRSSVVAAARRQALNASRLATPASAAASSHAPASRPAEPALKRTSSTPASCGRRASRRRWPRARRGRREGGWEGHVVPHHAHRRAPEDRLRQLEVCGAAEGALVVGERHDCGRAGGATGRVPRSPPWRAPSGSRTPRRRGRGQRTRDGRDQRDQRGQRSGEKTVSASGEHTQRAAPARVRASRARGGPTRRCG